MEFEQEWLQIYFQASNKVADTDLHQQFADLCDISRQEAKEICYKNMYQPSTPWLLKTMLRINREVAAEAKVLKV